MAEPAETYNTESNKETDVFESRKLPVVPVTLKMHNIDLTVLIQTLARVADLDIVINDSVKGKTNIAITKVPWDQVFLSILDTFNLAHEWSGDILRVVSIEDLKKKQAMMEARQNYEKTKRNHSLALMQLSRKKNQLQPLVTKIVKIKYADLHSLQKTLKQYLPIQNQQNAEQDAGKLMGKTAEQSAKGLLSKTTEKTQTSNTQGDIMIDEFSNSLILHASRADIKKMMPVIRQIDQPIRQILIEAHIVEAESNTGKELGIQWGGLGNAKTGDEKNVSIGGNMNEFGTPFPQDDDGNTILYQPSDGNIVNLPIDALTGMSFGVMFQKLGEYALYAQLLALEEQGKLNILSKPSITTLNNRKAVIKSGREVPFQVVESDEVSIEWKEAVIKLEVTPHVIDKNIIMLEIITHKDELDFTNSVNGNPTIITKNAETTVTLFDGQTTVIGGLSKEKSSGGEDGVPGLKNIPGLGWFFKSMDKKEKMEELLIFITPHILKKQTVNHEVQ